MSVAPIEYVILRKLEYFSIGGSDRHIRDIRSMLRLSGARIDFPELERWINREGLGSEWEHVSSH